MVSSNLCVGTSPRTKISFFPIISKQWWTIVPAENKVAITIITIFNGISNFSQLYSPRESITFQLQSVNQSVKQLRAISLGARLLPGAIGDLILSVDKTLELHAMNVSTGFLNMSKI